MNQIIQLVRQQAVDKIVQSLRQDYKELHNEMLGPPYPSQVRQDELQAREERIVRQLRDLGVDPHQVLS